jgi:GNAT superfamily N-acetyltransferase
LSGSAIDWTACSSGQASISENDPRHFSATGAQAPAFLKASRLVYRIREVDAHDDEIAEILADLHRLTFFGGASIPEFDLGHWWLAYHDRIPVAFAGIVPSTYVCNAGYICRVGVLKKHCGNALQLRLMRALESRAKQIGWRSVVSDTTGNIASANNFIKAGYRLYEPRHPWAWPNTLYWRRYLTNSSARYK